MLVEVLDLKGGRNQYTSLFNDEITNKWRVCLDHDMEVLKGIIVLHDHT